MQKYMLYVVLVLGMGMIMSCGNETVENGFLFKGKLTNHQVENIVINKYNGTGATLVAETNVASDGSFSLPIPNAEPAIYYLQNGTSMMAFVYEGTEKTINVIGDASRLNKSEFTIEGSPGSNVLKKYMEGLTNRSIKINAIYEMPEKNDHPLVYDYMVFRYLPVNDATKPFHQKAIAAVLEKYPNHKQANAHTKHISVPTRKNRSSNNSSPLKIGEVVPNISLPNVDGKIMKLSDLKGKVVLIDFWASWCGPCRRYGNPKLVKIYNKYDKQKIEIMNVALERGGKNEKWIAATKKDGLVWPYNLVDHDREFAPLYGASRIPRVYVIDQEGKLAAINPQGDALDSAIDNLLKT